MIAAELTQAFDTFCVAQNSPVTNP
jgi:hypothetical protein